MNIIRVLLEKIRGVLRMVADYDIVQAVAGTKNKASVYNENFNKMKKYVDDSVEDLTTETQNTLSLYQSVKTLATSGTIALETNTVNTITPQGAVTFSLPTITGDDAGKYHQILVQVNMSTVYTVDVGTTYYFNSNPPSLTAVGDYNLIYEYDNVKGHWVVGAISKGTI